MNNFLSISIKIIFFIPYFHKINEQLQSGNFPFYFFSCGEFQTLKHIQPVQLNFKTILVNK